MSKGRIASMCGALFALAVALFSPLDGLAERSLSAHMMQHLLLMLVVAPLGVVARPWPLVLRLLPAPSRRAVGQVGAAALHSPVCRVLVHPLTAGIVFCGTLAFWHLPAVFRWMLASESRHIAMHLTFLAAALLFWSVAMDPGRRRHRDAGARIVLVLATALITGIPGALLSFASQPLYVTEDGGPVPYGLTALQDQRLAGLLMWIPMDLVLFGAAAWLVFSWLAASSRAPSAVQ